MVSIFFSLLLGAWAQAADVVIHCASTNTADNGAYELIIYRTSTPTIEEAVILVDGEPQLFFKGHYTTGYLSFGFESSSMENPNLPELEVEGDLKYARVTLNNPKHESQFTETGLRRLSRLICK